jgi:hypothetical protein
VSSYYAVASGREGTFYFRKQAGAVDFFIDYIISMNVDFCRVRLFGVKRIGALGAAKY